MLVFFVFTPSFNPYTPLRNQSALPLHNSEFCFLFPCGHSSFVRAVCVLHACRYKTKPVGSLRSVGGQSVVSRHSYVAKRSRRVKFKFSRFCEPDTP